MASKTQAVVQNTALPVVPGEFRVAKVSPERLLQRFSGESGMGLDPFTFSKINVPNSGNQFEFDGPGNVNGFQQYLDCVILYAHNARQNYNGEAYDPGAQSHRPPYCASYDGVTGYGDPGGSCARCPLGRFEGPCHPYIYTYLLFPDRMAPVRLNVPMTSLKSFRQFVQDDLTWAGYSLNDAFVRIGLEKRQNATVGMVLTWELIGELPPELQVMAATYAKILKENLNYPVDASVDDPTQVPFDVKAEQRKEYHVCTSGCSPNDGHFQPDATGMMREVIVHQDDTGRMVIDAYGTRTLQPERQHENSVSRSYDSEPDDIEDPTR